MRIPRFSDSIKAHVRFVVMKLRSGQTDRVACVFFFFPAMFSGIECRSRIDGMIGLLGCGFDTTRKASFLRM